MSNGASLVLRHTSRAYLTIGRCEARMLRGGGYEYCSIIPDDFYGEFQGTLQECNEIIRIVMEPYDRHDITPTNEALSNRCRKVIAEFRKNQSRK
jgi:hypothetical protein